MKQSVTFVTSDGYRLPTARIRCYRFSDELKRRGFDTRVLSTVDHLGAKYDGDARSKLSDLKRVYLNHLLYKELERDPGIMYIQKVDYHFLAPLMLKRIRNKPFILDYDDYDLTLGPFRFFGMLPGFNAESLTKSLVREAGARIVASHLLKEIFDAWRPGTRLIVTGVDTDRFFPGVGGARADSDKVIFSWSGVVWSDHVLNGLEFMLACFSKIRRKDNVVVRLQGGGAMWNLVVKLAADYAGKIDVETLDWSHPDRMPVNMDMTDVGLLPLVQDSLINRAKSPTKLFEYMALGKATISSRIGEACHVIRDGASGFLVSDEDEWIAAIEALAGDAEKRKRMGAEALTDVREKYSLNKLGDLLEEAVKEVVA